MCRQFDLTDRQIHLLGPRCQRRQMRGIVVNEQSIGAFIHRQAAPGAEQFVPGLCQLARIGMLQHHAMPLQRQILQLLRARRLLLRLPRILPAQRMHMQDRALLVIHQPGAINHRAQCLLPGNVFR